jgi:hypothetical protein
MAALDGRRMEPKDWDHMGDGVYVKIDPGGYIVLHANSHCDPTDRIVLEPIVLRNLLRYLGLDKEGG